MKKVVIIVLMILLLTACGELNVPSEEVSLDVDPATMIKESQEQLIEEEEKDVPTKVAYITIDDGPSRENTPKILDLLKENHIKATFFVLPHQNLDDLYERIYNEGHEFANHSYSHNYTKLYSNDVSFFRDDVTRAREYIQDKFGYTTVSFRFPGGAMGRSETVLAPRREIIEDLGYRYFDWHVSTGDSDGGPDGKNVEALTNNVINNTKDREKLIILMHDSADKTATPEALKGIIGGLKEQGYRFDVLSNY